MSKIAPSILSSDFAQLGQELQAVEKAGADWIHVDVMDGHFVPNLTMGPDIVKAARKITSLPIDVHLMVDNPGDLVSAFVDAGADWISFHYEASPHSQKILSQIRDTGAKAGIALTPSTPVDCLEYLWPDLDYILIMSVNPGFSGQKFIPQSIEKIRDLDQIRKEKGHSDVLIQIDGGVSVQNASQLRQAGVDVLVSGSAIFSSANYAEVIQKMKA